MFWRTLRWIAGYLSTLLVAFILAIVVWFSAVTTADPNVESELSAPVKIDVIGKDAGLKLMQSSHTEARLQIKAPSSVWEQINNQSALVHAWIDLSNLGPGEHVVPLNVEIGLRPVRILRQDPEEVKVTLESVVTEMRSVFLVVNGLPPLGYQAEDPGIDPGQVTLSGPASLVQRVRQVRAQLDIAGATQSITQTVSLAAIDVDGKSVTGVTLTPPSVRISQPVNLLGGYRNVIVKVVTQGTVASGYRLTNYYANPTSVVVFSTNPALVDQLPGYVETVPLDLSGIKDDFEALLSLNVPEGIRTVTDSRVLVQVSVAAIEGSLTISLPVEITGLPPGHSAQVSPSTVDIILSGPVPVLNDLRPEDIRVKVDLTGFDVGTHQLIPVVDFLPAQVQKISIIPPTIAVTIVILPTLTVTPTASPTLLPH